VQVQQVVIIEDLGVNFLSQHPNTVARRSGLFAGKFFNHLTLAELQSDGEKSEKEN